jgi:hypothetical protein
MWLELALLCALAAGACFAPPEQPGRDPGPASVSAARPVPLPDVVLWAWERPEDLRFVDPSRVGIAYLACTIELRGERTSVRPRLQPISYPPSAIRMAVARVESSRRERPALTAEQRRGVVEAVRAAALRPGVAAVQVDFDAALSERAFYRELLVDLRAALPDSMPLSMTALASWGLYDRWLSDLPVDEAVPMLFRMGADAHRVRADLDAGADFADPVCRSSVGFSTDEPRPRVARGRRIYLFSPHAWTPAGLEAALRND